MDWKQVATILGIIGAGFTGGYWGWQKMVKPFFDFINNYKKLETKVSEHDNFAGHITYVSKKLDALLQLSDYAIFVCNDLGLCVLANNAICELFGASENQMRGYGWLNYLHSEDRIKAEMIWEQFINSGGRDIQTSYRIVHGKTEEVIHVTYHAIVERDIRGGIIVSVGKVTKKQKL